MHRPDNRFQLGQARHFYHLLLNGQQPVNAGAMAGIIEEMELMDAEIAALQDELSACTESPGGCGYWREAAKLREKERDEANAAKYLAETKETAVHHALNEMRGERDALRAILAPILAHAASHDYAPPLKFSVQQCRDIREKVNGI